MYEYIKRMYPVAPRVGQRVCHLETKRLGWVQREDKSAPHYVQVQFDGDGFPLPCHPTALDYADRNSKSAFDAA